MKRLEVPETRTAEKLAALAGRLYSLPAVALKVLDLVERPDVDAAVLRECIEKDPALASKILRVVNSSLYGPAQPIGDLGQALAFLGAKPLKLLVLGFSLPPKMFQGLEAKTLGYYWRRSLTKAVAARELSEVLKHRGSDECFIAGLLQDLGLLVFIQALGFPFQRFVEKVLEQRESLYQRERDVFGFDHRHVSAALLRHWGMPSTIVEVIAPPEDGGTTTAAATEVRRSILDAAELAALLLVEVKTEVWALWQLAVQNLVKGKSGISPEEILKQIHLKVGQLGDILSLRLPPGESLDKILATAHDALSREAEAVAARLLRPAVGFSCTTTPAEDQQLGQALHRYLETELSACGLPQASGKRDTVESSTARNSSPQWSSLPKSSREVVAESFEAGSDRTEWLPSFTDPGLLGLLRHSVAKCRSRRWGLSLLLADYQDVGELFVHLGPLAVEKLQGLLRTACERLEHPEASTWPYGDTGCAWVLPNCERETAVEYGYELIRTFQSGPVLEASPPMRLRIGVAYVATPAPNFPPQDLLTAAQRCLFASGTCGGGVVKSIEIY